MRSVYPPKTQLNLKASIRTSGYANQLRDYGPMILLESRLKVVPTLIEGRRHFLNVLLAI